MLLTPGFIVCAAFFILLLKLKHDLFAKLLGFDLWLDILATVLMMYMFAGTYAGMMAALVGGLAFSVLLIIAKRVVGYKKLVYVNDTDHLLPTFKWVDIPPFWKKKDPDLVELLADLEKEA